MNIKQLNLSINQLNKTFGENVFPIYQGHPQLPTAMFYWRVKPKEGFIYFRFPLGTDGFSCKRLLKLKKLIY